MVREDCRGCGPGGKGHGNRSGNIRTSLSHQLSVVVTSLKSTIRISYPILCGGFALGGPWSLAEEALW